MEWLVNFFNALFYVFNELCNNILYIYIYIPSHNSFSINYQWIDEERKNVQKHSQRVIA